ncbi:MAG: hypothetical protein BAJALOKI2v1_40050 [Promethearchaeota archaeon]|nr:MAG: hypothetical protein BAJALOKI2v1_40050 [Candidatus Lokiarchaeota archaeon]
MFKFPMFTSIDITILSGECLKFFIIKSINQLDNNQKLFGN